MPTWSVGLADNFLLTFLHPGYRGRSLPQLDGAVCGGALQPQQELLHAAGGVAEGGAAASRLPIVSDHRRTEGKLFQPDSQVSVCVCVFFLVPLLFAFGIFFTNIHSHMFVFFTNSSHVQRAGQQATDEGDREGVYVTVPRAPRHRVRRRVLSTVTRRSSAPQCRRHKNQTITRSQAALSMKTPWSDCNNQPAHPGHTREPQLVERTNSESQEASMGGCLLCFPPFSLCENDCFLSLSLSSPALLIQFKADLIWKALKREKKKPATARTLPLSFTLSSSLDLPFLNRFPCGF